MPTSRPHLFALLGAVAALMPGVAISGSVDVRVTSAIPVPGVQDKAQQAPSPSVAQLKSGLDALAAGDIAGARGVRDALPAQSLDQHILAWAIALYGGDKVPSGDIAAAAKMLPNWPGTVTLRKNSERALYRENPAADVVVKAFDGSQPQTFEGVMVLARAYVSSGNAKAARSVLSPFWRTAILEAKDETALIKEFGSLVPAADHRFRMERMFYADRVNSALRVAGLAGAQQLADAWAAADRGDKNAAKLLKAVPAAQRSAGYFFAQAEYLRKQQDFAGAAAVVMKAPADRDSLVDPDAWWVERRVLSRAYYWLGRAAEVGGPGNAKDYFGRAATYGTTFYGQLAAERVGRQALNIVYPQPSAADRRSFAGREAVSAIKRLQEAGYDRYAETLYRDLAGQLTSPGELALLAILAEKQDNHFMALKIGKIAGARGIDVGALSHPLGVIPDSANISGSGKALAYAVARQESEFNIGAISSAGARGLLQLMPATARQLAKKAGLQFSQTRLTTDAAYNATLASAFLGEQLDRFNGSYVLTFAGYNAGPARAGQWVAKYGDPRGKDIDAVVDWIERIPYTETRSYVQRVMENYEVYKMRISGKYDIVGDLVNGRS
ncbi:lytic transglycosylase domain-containing protein [Mesorhizobium sp. B2-3-15]|uniref:lytic transglycosylase domain-containing protein n=1 Tax=Mesorhizobium sp. B2-3-15 TaxID=2589949 RepID=UPI00112CD9F5|nr:lytic transglycosylase domain-containing protein [Mesorhizobium sp. B2-3-15]TPL69117.1 lytic transglycosylase domain-containing protein [Mesorhizobium sp. B2-3-15]